MSKTGQQVLFTCDEDDEDDDDDCDDTHNVFEPAFHFRKPELMDLLGVLRSPKMGASSAEIKFGKVSTQSRQGEM